MATTLDPASVTGDGNLTDGDLTLEVYSGGTSFASSTRAAHGKQTVQVTTSGIRGLVLVADSSVFFENSNPYFLVQYDSGFWRLYPRSGPAIATGPSSPAPTTSDIFTLDLDVPGKSVSVRINGTVIFSNIDVSASAPPVWNLVVRAGQQQFVPPSTILPAYQATAKFSALTYAPLAGYVEWDTAATATASPGDVDVSGPAGHAVTTAHVSALAIAANAHTAGEVVSAVASDHQKAFAEASVSSITGRAPIARASDHKSSIGQAGVVAVDGVPAYTTVGVNAFAIPGQVEIVGRAAFAAPTEHKRALAFAGSIYLVGQAGRAGANPIVVSALGGRASIAGARTVVTASRHQRALATTGRVSTAGGVARAFSLMSVVPREQSAIVQQEKRIAVVAPELRTAAVSADAPRDRAASVPAERRTSIVAGDRESRAAPERRNAVA